MEVKAHAWHTLNVSLKSWLECCSSINTDTFLSDSWIIASGLHVNNALAVYDTGSSGSWGAPQAMTVIIRQIPNIMLVLHGLKKPKQHLTAAVTSLWTCANISSRFHWLSSITSHTSLLKWSCSCLKCSHKSHKSILKSMICFSTGSV